MGALGPQLERLPNLLAGHVQITLLALAFGVAVSVPVGLVVARRPRARGVVLGLASVVQTIPSLALLAAMVPTLAWLAAMTGGGWSSIGLAPALVALSLYSMLPILRNTVTGLVDVRPDLIEAARGVGMTEGQTLFRVMLPQALPVIVAGVRTATVWVVGTATLSTPVGYPSLGNYIFEGLQTRNFAAVGVGCVSAAGLALLLDGVVALLERATRALPGSATRRLVWWGPALAVLATCAVVVVGLLQGRTTDAVPLRIGAKTFTEQYILAELLRAHLERATQVQAKVVPSLGSTMAFDALVQGDVDVYVDYSGTLWTNVLRRTDLADRAVVREEVARELSRRYDVEVAASLGFENAYALAMREGHAQSLGIERVSQLAHHAPQMVMAGDYELFGRPEWSSLRHTYGLAFRELVSMDSALMYRAVAQGDVDVISAYTTDPRIASFRLRVLDDDRQAVPPYDALVLLNGRRARDQPAVRAALGALEGAITSETMRHLNYEVDARHRAPKSVALEALAND